MLTALEATGSTSPPCGVELSSPLNQTTRERGIYQLLMLPVADVGPEWKKCIVGSGRAMRSWLRVQELE